jgi:hypothetical protein
MQFAARLRDRIRSGEIDRSVRIWHRPRVRPGGRYGLIGGGAVVVESIREIALADITPALARRCGFAGTIDLLKTAQHGSGTHIYLIAFHAEESDA